MTLRKRFPSYFKKSRPGLDEVDEGAAVLVLDSNVWLKFYELDSSAAEEFLDALKILKQQVWVPYQVGIEFLHNRVGTQKKQITRHQEAISEVEKLVNKISTAVKDQQHPYFTEEEATEFFLASEGLVGIIKEKKDIVTKKFEEFPDKDPILEKFESIVDDHVCEPPDEAILNQRFKSAKIRFEAKIPPGFKDNNKLSKGKFPYGDYLIWEELLDLASRENTPIVFVTADYKSDWWSGEEPRSELLVEFFRRTGQSLGIVSLKEFFGILPTFSETPVTEEAKSQARRLTEDRMAKNIERLEELGLFDELASVLPPLPDSDRISRLHQLFSGMENLSPDLAAKLAVLGGKSPEGMSDEALFLMGAIDFAELRKRKSRTEEEDSGGGPDSGSEGDI